MNPNDLILAGEASDAVMATVMRRFLEDDPGGAEGAALDKFVWEHSKGKHESLRSLKDALFPDGKAKETEEQRNELAEWACSLRHALTYRIATSAWYSSLVTGDDIGTLLVTRGGWGDRYSRATAAGVRPTVRALGDLLYKDLDAGKDQGTADRAYHVVADLEDRLGGSTDGLKAAAETSLVAVKLRSGLTMVDAPFQAVFFHKHASSLKKKMRCFLGFPRPFVVKKGSGVFPLNLDPDDDWTPEV